MVPHPIPALLLVGLLAGGLSGGLPGGSASDRVVPPVLTRPGCSPVGFDGMEGERAALVRTPRGRLVVVSLERGRAVYAGTRPGVLVGVCAERP